MTTQINHSQILFATVAKYLRQPLPLSAKEAVAVARADHALMSLEEKRKLQEEVNLLQLEDLINALSNQPL